MYICEWARVVLLVFQEGAPMPNDHAHTPPRGSAGTLLSSMASSFITWSIVSLLSLFSTSSNAGYRCQLAHVDSAKAL